MSAADETQPADGHGSGPGSSAMMRPSAGLIRVGDSLGRYLIVDRLGAGGMGVVYTAYDPKLDRKVALKLLHPKFEGHRQAHATTRLLREAQAMARLDHPNVVSVHDVGTYRGEVFIAMEHVDGETVKRWLSVERRDVTAVCDVYRQAALGLAAAHAAGLVHRDFKPENLMIGSDGRTRVMDFGLARAHDSSHGRAEIVGARKLLAPEPEADSERAQRANDRIRGRLAELGKLAPESSTAPGTKGGSGVATDASHRLKPEQRPFEQALTRQGKMIGTPAYMSPEQLAGEDADAKSDQFSLCVALYEALYRVHPFAAPTVHEMVARVLTGKYDAPPVGTVVPRWLARLVLKGLAQQPADRHADLSTVAALLKRGPRIRRTGFVAAGVAGVVVIAAAGLGRESEACKSSAEAFAPAWNPQVRTAVSAGLAASGAPFSEPAAANTLVVLDRYAERWIAMHRQSCRATQIRGDQSVDMLDLRAACLAKHRARFEALTHVLREADVGVAERAVEAANRLPSIERCGDLEGLLRAVPPPVEPQTVIEVESIRQGLAHAEALESAGRYSDAVEQGRALAERAKSSGYSPVLSEALLSLGVSLDGAGLHQESAEAIRRSARVARAARHDEVAARAETWLVYVIGYRSRELAEARWWSEQAHSAIERLGERPVLQGRLATHRGVVSQISGLPEVALSQFKRGLQLRESSLGVRHLDVAESHHNIGLALVSMGKYREAGEHHKEALAIRQEALGAAHPRVAESLNALGMVAFRRGESSSARESFDRALAVQKAAYGDSHPKVAATLNNLASEAGSNGQLARAQALLEQAVAIWESKAAAADPAVERGLYNLGVLAAKRGNYVDAIALYQRAFEGRTKKLGPKSVEAAKVLVAMGDAYAAMGDARSAQSSLERAMESLADGIVEPAYLAQAQFSLAKVLAAKDRTDPRVEQLAAQAQGSFARAGPSMKDRKLDVQRWLKGLKPAAPR